jgi:leucyl/phenylalanyl-tRNA---protein transferase
MAPEPNPRSMKHPSLTWLEPGEPFPAVQSAWPVGSEAPGLLAAGSDLSTSTLLRAYSGGIFPWFSADQPILWWSTDPRMVLPVAEFRLRRSLRQVLVRFTRNPRCEVRIDSAFSQVIAACANTPRRGQPGTWILPAMVEAYTALHQAGHAHSIETWIDGQLVGGLYCVAIGRAVFGESMFSLMPDASKIALAALVVFCLENGIALIDCQQNTAHLASLGAHEVPRNAFLEHIGRAQLEPSVKWHFSPLYWNQILSA